VRFGRAVKAISSLGVRSPCYIQYEMSGKSRTSEDQKVSLDV
jgi:hypothetical protein